MNKMICKVKKTIQPKTLVDSSKRVYWNKQKFGWFNNISLWNQSNIVNQMMSLEELFFYSELILSWWSVRYTEWTRMKNKYENTSIFFVRFYVISVAIYRFSGRSAKKCSILDRQYRKKLILHDEHRWSQSL